MLVLLQLEPSDTGEFAWYSHLKTGECVPGADIRLHQVGADCWCRPDISEGFVSHNAGDGREDYESGRRVKH